MIAMGAGYAAWTQSFTVTAQVDTGQLSVLVDDFGIGTTIRTMRVEGPEGENLAQRSGYNGDVVTNPDGSAVYTPPASNQMAYADANLFMPADRESLIFTLNNAYPGLYYHLDVRMKNEGTIPAVLNEENPVSFVGVGPMKELADHLYAQGHIDFSVQPNENGDPLGNELDLGHIVPLDIEIWVKSSMPEQATVNGVVYDLESKEGGLALNLSYELVYNIKQYNK